MQEGLPVQISTSGRRGARETILTTGVLPPPQGRTLSLPMHSPDHGSDASPTRSYTANKLVLILTRHTLARAGLANRLLDRHEVVTIDGDVDTLRQATP